MVKSLIAALLLLAVVAAPASADWSGEEPTLERSMSVFYTHQGQLLRSSWVAPADYDDAAAEAAYAAYGQAGAGAVMARSYARSLSTLDVQADCWAGAWLAERELDTAHPLTFPEVKRVVDGMLAAEGERHALAAIVGWSGYDPRTGATPCMDTGTLRDL